MRQATSNMQVFPCALLFASQLYTSLLAACGPSDGESAPSSERRASANQEPGAAVSQIPIAPGRRLLAGEELRSAITGRYVISIHDRGQRHKIVEHFCSDGQWGMYGTRAPVRGTYTIEGESLCTTDAGDRRTCRKVYREGSRVWIEWPGEVAQEFDITPDDGSC